jgi:hypothetical protein
METAISQMLKAQYLEQDQKIEECVEFVRQMINGKIKIIPQDLATVEIVFPSLLSPTPILRAPKLYGDRSKKNQQEEEDAKSHERSNATTTTT